MKDSKEPFLILIVLFILFGLAYGPLKNASLKNNLSRSTSSSIGTTESGEVNVGYSPNKDIAKSIKDIEREIKDLEEEAREATEKGKLSPYYGKVALSGVSGLYGDDPDREYMTLSTYLDNGETLKITGWYLKSEVTGYYAFIGKASLLPFPFTRTESDIVLERSDRVILTKGFSPVGVSFRTNKCTGFFEENRTFTPSLPLECPLPRDEKLPVFSPIHDRNDECLNIIESIPRCTTRDTEFIRDLPDTVAGSCKTYITTQINYNVCVAKHFGDTDFPGNEYRIYLNKFGPLWRERRDKINLYDENNLIVDTISWD